MDVSGTIYTIRRSFLRDRINILLLRGSNVKPVALAQDIYRISANIGSRDLFEGIWPIPNGVSLNSYLVKGSRYTALIDLVKDWEGAAGSVSAQLKDTGCDITDIDYLILNHMEPDHTGWLADVKQKHPQLKILCSKRAVPLVEAFYGFSDQVQAVSDGETLDLGGKQLVFYDAPNVHWPETMVTYEPASKILFSCDAFGSFGQVHEAVFDDQLSDLEMKFFEGETLRYYANIVSSFSIFVQRAIKKLSALDISIIAPSHGIIWRKNPASIITMYERLASYMNGPAEQEVTLVWSSMYGNTEALVDAVVSGLDAESVPVNIHRVPQDHVSYVLASAWRSSGIIIGMPTYEYRMFPPMYSVLDVLERSHVMNRKAFRFGSYGWSGGAQKQFDEFSEKMKWECLGSVEFHGAPSREDRETAYGRARELAQRVKQWTL